MPAAKDVVRVAAIGDLHFGRTAPAGSLQPLFSQINDSADVLVLCGDLTDYGLPEEAQAFARELSTTVKIPMVAVLGNHDYESGQQDEVAKNPRRRRRHDARRRHHRDPRHRLRRRQGLRRRIRPARARPLGRGDHQEVRPRSDRRGAEARIRAGASAHRTPDRAAPLRPRFRQPSKASRSRSIRSSAAAASRSRSRATPCTAVFHGHAHHGPPEGRTRD